MPHRIHEGVRRMVYEDVKYWLDDSEETDTDEDDDDEEEEETEEEA